MDCCPLAFDNDCDEKAWETVSHCIARKAHICCECGETINPGDPMHLLRQMYCAPIGERWAIWKTCKPCATMRSALSCNEGYYLGEMRNLLKQYYGLDYVTGEPVAIATGDEVWYTEEIERFSKLGLDSI